MRKRISFLTMLAVALCANYAKASECIGDYCELDSVYVTDESYQVVTQSDTAYGYYTSVCPFDTESECVAWYKKPVYKTNVLPRTPHINSIKMDDILRTVRYSSEIDAGDIKMSPLLERYQMLMRASNACCGTGIVYKMRSVGASDEDVYEFLKKDANKYAVTLRCMVMNDDEIKSSYSNGVTGQMVADVRNACLCKNRQWFETLLQPFADLYIKVPQFESAPFLYTFTESMQREVTVDINNDVQTTLGLMSVCPK